MGRGAERVANGRPRTGPDWSTRAGRVPSRDHLKSRTRRHELAPPGRLQVGLNPPSPDGAVWVRLPPRAPITSLVPTGGGFRALVPRFVGSCPADAPWCERIANALIGPLAP